MNRISALLDSLNTGEQWIFRLAAISVIIGCIGIGTIALSYITISTADYGGTYTEGVIGYPTAPNPILATASTDQSLTRLVYSGILRKISWNNYVDDLGRCTQGTSENTVVCTISEQAYFHDNEPIQSDDIIFTIETIQKIGERSPWYPSLVGVTVTKKSEKSVEFNLPKPFSGFSETLTVGIIPKHIWENVPVTDIESRSTLEEMMIGSGPYYVAKHTSSNDHISTTTLKSYNKYTHGQPYISTLKLKYYTNTDDVVQAYNKKSIDGFVLESEEMNLTESIKNPYKRLPIVHPDIYGVFTKSSLTKEKGSLSALENHLRSIQIADFGLPWYQHLPPWNAEEILDIPETNGIIQSIGNSKTSLEPVNTPDSSRVLVTVDQESLINLSTTVSRVLNAIGLPTEMRVFDFGGFKNSVVPKRTFNFLVFGQRYRHVSDAYAYWNSDERVDPGLNITETVNANIDTYTNSLTRKNTIGQPDQSLYKKLNQKISSERVFLPLYLDRDIYVFNPEKTPIHQAIIYNPTVDRFNSINNWYLHTTLTFKKSIWPK